MLKCTGYGSRIEYWCWAMNNNGEEAIRSGKGWAGKGEGHNYRSREPHQMSI